MTPIPLVPVVAIAVLAAIVLCLVSWLVWGNVLIGLVPPWR